MTSRSSLNSKIDDVEMNHKYVELNDITLHVVTAGNPEDKPIVLLHGFPDYWKSWKYQVSALVNSGYFLIMPDQRGFGLSSKPKNTDVYILENLADDIIRLIDSMNIEKTALIGHDWGGTVAWSVAEANSDRITKVIVINAPNMYSFERPLFHSVKQVFKSWYVAVMQIPIISTKLLHPYTVFRVGNKYRSFLDEEHKQMSKLPGVARGTANWYRAAVRRIIVNRGKTKKPNIVVPALLLWGQGDLALTDTIGQQAITFCNQGKLITIKDGTHWPHWTKSKMVNNDVVKFLS